MSKKTIQTLNHQVRSTERHSVFFISDRTGLAAETYGKSLLAQFPDKHFDYLRLPFVDSEEKALIACGEIDEASIRTGVEPIVFSTLVDPANQKIIENCNGCVLGLFDTFIEPLEKCLGEESAHTLGLSEHIFKKPDYERRLDAIDYCLAHDDGVRPDQYDQADVIITGVSRCGKTPVSLYLAMNFSIKVANYPITDEELQNHQLPTALSAHKNRLIGLTINPIQLSHIRMNRRATEQYASLQVCQREVRSVEQLFRLAHIPVFDSTKTSIEELAGNIMQVLKTT